MSTESGTVLEVRIVPTGSELSSDAVNGTTSIIVEEPYFFSESGGTLDIDGALYTYTGYDDTTRVISGLSPSLPTIKAAGTKVLIYPYGYTKKATVDIDDDEDALQVVVPFGQYEKYPDGIRDEVDQEAVIINDDNGYWEISGPDGENPIITNAEIEGGVITGATIQTAADGNRAMMTAGMVWFYPGIVGLNEEAGWIRGTSVLNIPYTDIQSPTNDTYYQRAGMTMVAAGVGDRPYIMMGADLKLASNLDIVFDTSNRITGMGRALSRLDFGNKTGNTNASSEISISHNLGVAPVCIQTLNNGAAGRSFTVVSYNSATITVRCKDQAGVDLGSGVAIDFFWLAIA